MNQEPKSPKNTTDRVAYCADGTWCLAAEKPNGWGLDIWLSVEMPCENYNFLVSRKEIESLHTLISSFLEQLPK